MAPYRYELLKDETTFELDEHRDGDISKKDGILTYDARRRRNHTWILGVLLALSVSLNIFHYATSLSSRHFESHQTPAAYFDLPRNKETKMLHDTRTLDDPIWTDERHNIFTGMVALDDDFVKEKNLPQAQRYPWDETKSLYYLNGFHSMHCVMVLRDVVIDVRDSRNMTWSLDHVTHCLHDLREDVECFADDMPLYTGRYNGQEHREVTRPGEGQNRICRDWDQLRELAIKNTACWNQNLIVDPDTPVIESYKDCPDGSKPWDKVE